MAWIQAFEPEAGFPSSLSSALRPGALVKTAPLLAAEHSLVLDAPTMGPRRVLPTTRTSVTFLTRSAEN